MRHRVRRWSVLPLLTVAAIGLPRALAAQSDAALPLPGQGQPIYTTPTSAPTPIGQPFPGGQLGQPMEQSLMMGGQFLTGNPMLDAYQARTRQMMMRSLATPTRAPQMAGAAGRDTTGAAGGFGAAAAANTVVQPGAGGGRPPLRMLGGQRLTPFQLCVRDGGCPGLPKDARSAAADSTTGGEPPMVPPQD